MRSKHKKPRGTEHRVEKTGPVAAEAEASAAGDASVTRGFRWALVAALAAFLLAALYAGYYSGRALWCDEILNLSWQKLSLADLLKCEHNRQSSSQTSLSYFVQRPFVSLLGYELGGIAAAALAGALLVLATALTACKSLGRRAGLLALALTATNPLVLYFSSELAFYIFWGAAAACVFGLLLSWLRNPSAFTVRGKLLLALAVFGMAGFHFAGLFVWLVTAATAGLLLLLQTPPPGRWRQLTQFAAVMACPVVLLAPMYVQAQRVQFLMGTKTLDPARIMPAVLDALGFPLRHFLSLPGGGYTLLGLAAFLAGVGALWLRGRRYRPMLVLAVAMCAAIIPFIFFVSMRQHFLNVTRYYLYAATPAGLLVAAGFDRALGSGRRPVRVLGRAGLAALLLVNALTCAAVLTARGRPGPLRDIAALIGTLPAGRTVVCPNQYETRFLGSYYPIPNSGVMTSPCYWEEGLEARAEGLRRIWKLVPDAILFLPNEEYGAELRGAGLDLPAQKVFQYSALLRLSYRLRTFPEKGYSDPGLHSLRYLSPDDIALRAERNGECVVVPGEGWKTVRYRSMADGKVAFALLASSGGAGLRVYSPTNQTADLRLALQPYAKTALTVEAAGGPGNAVQLAPGPAQGVVVQTRKAFSGMISPDMLDQAGIQFALKMQATSVNIGTGRLQKGWNVFSLRTAPAAPLLLLSHELVVD